MYMYQTLIHTVGKYMWGGGRVRPNQQCVLHTQYLNEYVYMWSVYCMEKEKVKMFMCWVYVSMCMYVIRYDVADMKGDKKTEIYNC